MKTVFDYFEEILNIPRESGKEEKIANYIIEYAKERNIEYKLGKNNTVFLRKDNNSNKTIILQAHSDMVCVSTNNYDFDNKGIPYYIEDGYYKARNTSLGADDGIGLAIILAILEEKDNMPNIEVIVTTEEETTMKGASNFDYSLITGNTLISLDGIKEGDIESSSAGMCSITINKSITRISDLANTYKISISGLAGGHSGDDIDKKRCNAIKLVFNILKEFDCKEIVDISIGTKDNVIPSEGYVVFKSNYSLEELNDKLSNMNLLFTDDDKNVVMKIEEELSSSSIFESKDIFGFIDEVSDGLLETYEIDKFPLLSANIGKISVNNDILEIKYSIRSSDINKENDLIEKIKQLTDKYKYNMSIDARKPFFPFKGSSLIRSLLTDSYERLYKKKTAIKKVHACMEGGILSNNIPNLDICTIAPTIDNCHSINERVSISSTKRVYEWLKDTLIRYNKANI